MCPPHMHMSQESRLGLVGPTAAAVPALMGWAFGWLGRLDSWASGADGRFIYSMQAIQSALGHHKVVFLAGSAMVIGVVASLTFSSFLA